MWHYSNNAEVLEFFNQKRNGHNFQPPFSVVGAAPTNSHINVWDSDGNLVGERQVPATFRYSINTTAKTLTIDNYGNVNSWLAIKAIARSDNRHINEMWVFSTPSGIIRVFDLSWLDLSEKDFFYKISTGYESLTFGVAQGRNIITN